MPLAFLLLFLTSLDTTYQFHPGSSRSRFGLPSFLLQLPLGGSASIHARSSEDPSDSFPFLECRVLQHNRARVLYGAVLEEASWTVPSLLHWFLKLRCILFLFNPPAPQGCGEGRAGVGGFCVFSFLYVWTG